MTIYNEHHSSYSFICTVYTLSLLCNIHTLDTCITLHTFSLLYTQYSTGLEHNVMSHEECVHNGKYNESNGKYF